MFRLFKEGIYYALLFFFHFLQRICKSLLAFYIYFFANVFHIQLAWAWQDKSRPSIKKWQPRWGRLSTMTKLTNSRTFITHAFIMGPTQLSPIFLDGLGSYWVEGWVVELCFEKPLNRCDFDTRNLPNSRAVINLIDRWIEHESNAFLFRVLNLKLKIRQFGINPFIKLPTHWIRWQTFLNFYYK